MESWQHGLLWELALAWWVLLSNFYSTANIWIKVITNGTASMAGRISYQLPLYILFGMPAVIFCTLPFLPESPVSVLELTN
jgi:hypothetical protein